MIKATCTTNSKHKEFVTTAHEAHDWVVNENGEFIKDLRCNDIVAHPDIGNIWTCHICGATAKVKIVND